MSQFGDQKMNGTPPHRTMFIMPTSLPANQPIYPIQMVIDSRCPQGDALKRQISSLADRIEGMHIDVERFDGFHVKDKNKFRILEERVRKTLDKVISQRKLVESTRTLIKNLNKRLRNGVERRLITLERKFDNLSTTVHSTISEMGDAMGKISDNMEELSQVVMNQNESIKLLTSLLEEQQLSPPGAQDQPSFSHSPDSCAATSGSSSAPITPTRPSSYQPPHRRHRASAPPMTKPPPPTVWLAHNDNNGKLGFVFRPRPSSPPFAISDPPTPRAKKRTGEPDLMGGLGVMLPNKKARRTR
ncbi:hypothetical protein QBC35DRAFT_471149 [Podospora australis]|uniref:Uncharacterized protein n=1 Tax=Podospora australis TaxID=1536484 RepID=A0AAN6WZA3_9PEZI|nr:hypothetical protein QBC35DRAFT_471149 [Podospora australis]